MIESIIFEILFSLFLFFLVLGILNRLNIFDSKIINYIISFSISLYSFLNLKYINLFSTFIAFFLVSILFILFLSLIVIVFSIVKKQYKK